MNRTNFFRRLPDKTTSEAVTALEAFCASRTDISAYFTGAAGGDLRVRIGSRGRVVLTVVYQPRKQQFFCRAFCLPGVITAMEIPAKRVRKPLHPKQPLRSEFWLTRAEFVTHIKEIALAGATSYRNEFPAK